MKKNIAMRVASLILMCTIITSCFVSSTFAKYTSKIEGTATATVANWAVALKNGSDTPYTNGATFDLFSTITDDNGDPEADVVDGKIAPGTKGSFAFKIANTSDVSTSYTLTFTVSGATVPLAFTASGATLTNNGAGVYTLTLPDDDLLGKAALNVDKTITVNWEWPFYVDADKDTADTNLGTAASKTVNVAVAFTATQKN